MNAGGAERLLLEEHEFLKRRGLNTYIVSFEVNQEALFDYEIPHLEVLKSGKGLFARAFALRKKILELQPDVIVSATGAIELYLATLFTGIPYFLHIHGTLFWFDDESLKYALIHKRRFNKIRNSVVGHRQFIAPNIKMSLIKRFRNEYSAIFDYITVRKARACIVLTPQIQWEVKQLYGVNSTIAKGCLDPAVLKHKPKLDLRKNLGISDSKKIILSVCRLDRRKRLDVLIQAFAQLSSKSDEAVLIIAGTGSDEKRLKSLAQRLNCMNNVFFVGFVDDSDVWDYYQNCDVFAFPGWTTSPITTYEALAFQKNVVWTTEASEPSEILNDPHVFMTNPDPKSFADALEKALSLKVNTPIDLSKHTWDHYFDTVWTVLTKEVIDPFSGKNADSIVEEK